MYENNYATHIEVEITGYEIVRVDRNRNGKGVAIYQKTIFHITYEVI